MRVTWQHSGVDWVDTDIQWTSMHDVAGLTLALAVLYSSSRSCQMRSARFVSIHPVSV